jgi:hypothetical protein
MSVASPNPQNMVLLGALGIAAYWFATRQASAAPVARPGQLAPASDPMGTAFAAFGRLFGSGPTTNYMGTYDGRAMIPWSTSGTPGGTGAANNPSAYVGGSVDGAAINIPNVSPWDAFFGGTGGSGD